MNDLTIKPPPPPPPRHIGKDTPAYDYKTGYNRGFIVGALSAAAIIFTILWLTSCTAPQEITDPPLYQAGGVYTENDSIIGSDTMFYWTR